MPRGSWPRRPVRQNGLCPAQRAGVVSIPPSDFYSDEHKHIGANYLRLAFCKDVETLKAAGERLFKLKPFLSS